MLEFVGSLLSICQACFFIGSFIQWKLSCSLTHREIEMLNGIPNHENLGSVWQAQHWFMFESTEFVNSRGNHYFDSKDSASIQGPLRFTESSGTSRCHEGAVLGVSGRHFDGTCWMLCMWAVGLSTAQCSLKLCAWLSWLSTKGSFHTVPYQVAHSVLPKPHCLLLPTHTQDKYLPSPLLYFAPAYSISRIPPTCLPNSAFHFEHFSFHLPAGRFEDSLREP